MNIKKHNVAFDCALTLENNGKITKYLQIK